jgi:hypothetical protein
MPRVETSVADPDPSDLYGFGPPGSGSGSVSQRYGLRLLSSSKISKQNLDFYCCVTFFIFYL